MKRRIIIAALLTLTTIALRAQKDVTKFLGIPVEGTKSAMIQKLKAKGFISDTYYREVLKGEFNGVEVNVHIATNNNKVCRIMVCDANTLDEARIKIRFNNLVQQFLQNKKYIPSMFLERISDEENISYEMSVKNKRYDALFYQLPEQIDTLSMHEAIRTAIAEKFTEEQLSEPTEEVQESIGKEAYMYLYSLCSNKTVWFTINEFSGEYYITIYYDNEYNKANGEDL